ncbi:MAG: PIN domain-containing protein [Candidatus Korobacteraceae bacterium]|jgi:predicted nucleic acid-binding protein
MRIHVLDASALYRYLTNGAAEEIVARVLKEAAATDMAVLMSVINWGEVYYTLVKHIGLNKTDRLMTELLGKIPISLIGVAPEDAVRAARLKAQYHIPYADAFAAALTRGQHVLVTADVEHFERVPKLRLLKLPRAKKADA